MVVPLCQGVTLTGSDNGYFYKLPEGLFSLASDNADDDLLPKAFRVTPFFYVDSNPRVFLIIFSLMMVESTELFPVIMFDHSEPPGRAYSER